VDTDWPSWSPDGTSIVYSSQAPGVNTSDIFIIPVTGGTQRRLTDDAASDTTPSWSRDGRLIYFLSDRDGVFRVWKMPAEGGPAVRLSQSDAAILPPVDSPDGEWVYFQAGRILRVPAAGGDEQEIVTERFFGPLLPTSQGLYYMVGADDFLSTTLRLVPLDGGTPKVLGTIPYRTLGRISLSPDAKSVLYSRCDQCEADIMLVENFR
jgi:dipeptidyl aminopeptidase/acylaminoacyl peptidase